MEFDDGSLAAKNPDDPNGSPRAEPVPYPF